METTQQGAILISGGRGFVGRATAKLLRRSGHRVISLDHDCAVAGALSAPGPKAGSDFPGEEIVCDITDRSQLRAIFESAGLDAVIHLAAILPTAAQREPVRATDVNVEGSLNLLEMARQFGLRRFVLASSLSVYGTCPTDQVVSETDRAAPEDLYGAAKLYVEQLGHAYRQAQRMEFVSLRIGRVVGAGARSATSAWRSGIFEQLAASTPAEIMIPYAESERVLLVHVDDVAKMLLELMQARQLAHSLYNAACESIVVADLKLAVERLNPQIRVSLGGQTVLGNPRRVDWSRFEREFDFAVVPIFEQLAHAAKAS